MARKLRKLIEKNKYKNALLILATKMLYKIFVPVIKQLIHGFAAIRKDRLVFIGTSKADVWQADNGKVLTDYLIEKKKGYEIIWLVKDPKTFMSRPLGDDINIVRCQGKHHGFLTLKALYYIKTANFVFCTHTFFKIREKNNKPTVVNLWHGCGYKDAGNAHNYFDYFIVPGEIFIETKAKAYSCEKNKILPLGYPRYDLFKPYNTQAENYICKLKSNKDEKLIIWMPTIRATNDYDFPENNIQYNFELPIVKNVEGLKKLNDYCISKNIILIVKKHIAQVEYQSRMIELTNIVFIDDEGLETNQIDLYEILRYTDAMLTDYSSAAIDYLLLDKPLGFTLDDFNQYKDARGFVFDDPREYMPGYHIYDDNDLCAFINEVANGIDSGKQERKRISEIAHIERGEYCKNIVDFFEL